MFHFTRTGIAALLGAGMAICATSAGYATPAVTTNTLIFFGNDSDPTDPNSYHDTTIDPHSSSTGAAVTSQYSGSFTGENSGGNSQTMQVSATGNANAQYGALKASSSLHLTTPYANTTANAPYTNADFSSNPAGIPDFFEAQGTATLKDTLSIQSAASVSTLRLTFHLDGTITDNNLGQAMSSIIQVYDPNTFSNYYISATPGAVDTNVIVNLNVTDPNAIDLALALATTSSAFLDIGGYSESGTYTLDADFYNTLELTGIEGLDANGGQVALNSVSGASGTNYLALLAPPPATGAPEPATLMLFGAGLAGLRLRKRKSSK